MISKLNRRNIFLVDSIGAMLTASLLFFVLATHYDFFGVSRKSLLILAGIGAVFGVYSMLCHLLLKEKWQPFLLIIALLNISYCLFTCVLLIWHLPTITSFGIAYFIGEIFLILGLVLIELRIVKH
jgi:hypothetical protein